ncbi:MAG: hypothetical protein RMM30_01865 [Armatimonadota bacterium]|nr:hypothetical protein [Armatimonadota bacterium]MDW8155319.1 hypothetical protein [Armatimonadota bacterium]
MLNFEDSDRFVEREQVAMRYTSALVWELEIADDAMSAKLYEHFTVPEIVELGFFVALTFGHQRCTKALGIRHGEVLAYTTAGLRRGFETAAPR